MKVANKTIENDKLIVDKINSILSDTVGLGPTVEKVIPVLQSIGIETYPVEDVISSLLDEIQKGRETGLRVSLGEGVVLANKSNPRLILTPKAGQVYFYVKRNGEQKSSQQTISNPSWCGMWWCEVSEYEKLGRVETELRSHRVRPYEC